MAYTFPSADWVSAYREAIDGNAAYREAAENWTHGAVALLCRAEPSIGFPDDVCIWLDLDCGICHDARMLDGSEAARAPFCIKADYAQWKEVIRGGLDPIAGILLRKLELEGDLATIIRFTRAAEELVSSATQVPTRFLDD